mmetsp:Transcript_10149/g.15182  ORF Transcript_10149/g.15182 Transcript_10149/m.15182 type:complete len:230 (+) Transcript_10149:12-701(+)
MSDKTYKELCVAYCSRGHQKSKSVIQDILKDSRKLSKMHSNLVSSKVKSKYSTSNKPNVPKVSEGIQCNFTEREQNKKSDQEVSGIMQHIEFDNPILIDWYKKLRQTPSEESNNSFSKVGNWNQNTLITSTPYQFESSMLPQISHNALKPVKVPFRSNSSLKKTKRRSISVAQQDTKLLAPNFFNEPKAYSRAPWKFKANEKGVFSHRKILQKSSRRVTPTTCNSEIVI